MKILFVIALSFLISAQQEKSAMDVLLEHPFDLQKFKKAKGPSNSGVADSQPYFFKPAEKGRYFSFFLFRAPHTYVFSAKGDKKNPVRSGSGFQLTTYKPDGEYQDDYVDPNESLIELTASYNDEDLPELALVGLDTLTIKKRFGARFTRKDNCFVYTNANASLVLNIAGSVVACLKYTKLKQGVTAEILPKELTYMKCGNQQLR